MFLSFVIMEGVGVGFMLMTWDAAMCTAYYELGYRAAQTLPAYKIRSLWDVACREGYCDCFREGYVQGVAEREKIPSMITPPQHAR